MYLAGRKGRIYFSSTDLITASILSFVARSESIPQNDLEKCTGHQHAFLDKQSRAGHAFQFTHVRRLLCSRRERVLEHAFLECAKKSPCGRELHFLRGLEPTIRRPAFFHDSNGFLARQTNCQGERTSFAARLVGWERLHEREHARVF